MYLLPQFPSLADFTCASKWPSLKIVLFVVWNLKFFSVVSVSFQSSGLPCPPTPEIQQVQNQIKYLVPPVQARLFAGSYFPVNDTIIQMCKTGILQVVIPPH